MGSEAHGALHILFFPLMAPGHMLPMVDMAKLFAARGLKPTIFTTPGNVRLIQPSIDNANGSGHQNPIQLFTVPFPSIDGIPDGCENLSSVTQELHVKFFVGLGNLREPFKDSLARLRPDCIVSDMFLPWTADEAAERGMPRLVFHGSNFFTQCAYRSIEHHKVLESLAPGEDTFVIPGLPHRVELRRSTMPDIQTFAPELMDIILQTREAELKSLGTVMNTFYELEPDYADHFCNVMGRRAWNIGPLSLCNKDVADKWRRGNEASITSEFCLNWLDSQEPSSVVYVCFGSLSDFTTAQLREIAAGLEASGRPFVWVVRNHSEEWIPEGLEERVGGKGLIIRGWAPQILILSHVAVGGFLTHCGWNSILEGVSAGLPFVTWPLFADQFYNERLIVDVLKIGVAVGSNEYANKPEERKIIEAAKIEATINELMGDGKDADERREKARALGELAQRAVEKGGSSYRDLDNLISELVEKRSAV
uniref:Flavonoid glycosyltransferase n=1 Tax=Albuca bracteata TaxID=82047 RepID=A0A2S1FLU1_ALBBR|nr:flavonoid glycosyltransferase [Albuca bracteata]